jgi:hypothetical protein
MTVEEAWLGPPPPPAAQRRDGWPAVTASLALVLVGCGDNLYRNPPYYDWDDTTAVGAFKIDQLGGNDRGLLDAVDSVRGSDSVVLFYGHNPPAETTYEAIETLLGRAEQDGLEIFTFADRAAPRARHAGICLSFDDTDVDAWYALRGLLARHHAHVSFFVTQYTQLTEDQHAELHVLYAEGNSIEAHGVNHALSTAYIPQYGLQAYLDSEVQPSIDVLRGDGFTPVAYAHPGGAHTRELDEALAPRIRFARSISGQPR